MQTEYKELLGQLQSLQDNSKSLLDPKEPDSIWQKDIDALDEAMDIINDYAQMAEQYRAAVEKYETAKEAVSEGFGAYHCPDCGRTVNFRNEHCHWCGRKMGWGTHRAGQTYGRRYQR